MDDRTGIHRVLVSSRVPPKLEEAARKVVDEYGFSNKSHLIEVALDYYVRNIKEIKASEEIGNGATE